METKAQKQLCPKCGKEPKKYNAEFEGVVKYICCGKIVRWDINKNYIPTYKHQKK